MPRRLKPRAQTVNEHLLRSLWPLQGAGKALLKGRHEGAAQTGAFLRRPQRASYETTPWGSRALDFAAATAIALPVSPLSGLSTFTLEAWLRVDDLFAGQQVILEHVGEPNDGWRLMLDRWGRLMLMWLRDTPVAADRAAIADRACGGGGDGPADYKLPTETRVCQAVHLADVLAPKTWHHLAVFCDGLRYLEICLTPPGELFPRSVRVARPGPVEWHGTAPGRMIVGGGAGGGEFLHGSLCDLAVFPHLKRRNEFPALGQRPPRSFRISADFPLGSALLPVASGENKVTVGCRPAPYQQKSFWFYARLDRVAGKEIELEILPWPGSTAMLSAPWVSYDGRNWTHERNAHWSYEYPNNESMTFRHRFRKSPAYVAVSLPYGLREIDELETTVAGSRFVRCVDASTSTEGRRLRLFYCTDPDATDAEKKTIYMQAGQHSPAEMMAGRGLDAAVRLLARPRGRLRELLRRAVLMFVPVVNQDTAFHGCSSSVACGVNLNRDWWAPRSPEVQGLKKFIINIHENVAPVQIAIDFHGGGGWRAHTVLCRWENVNESAFAGCHARQERWLDALTTTCDFNRRDIVRETRSLAGDPVGRGIFGATMRFQLHITAMSPELSNVVGWDRRHGVYTRLTQRAVERLGPDLLNACCRFFEV